MNHINGEEGSLDFSKLTDEELKLRIQDINNKQLLNVGDMAYNFFIGTSGNIIRLSREKDFLSNIKAKEKKKIIESLNIIVDSFIKIHEDMDMEEIDKNINILLETREYLYCMSEAIYGYKIELSYIKELLDHYAMKILAKAGYEGVDIEKEQIDHLIDNISGTLSSKSNDSSAYVSIVSSILGILPFRMSKYKYFDIIKSTLIRNLSPYTVNVVEDRIEKYKILFDSTLLGDYGVIFDNYFTHIQKLKKLEFENKSKDELEGIAEEIVDLSAEIEKLSGFIHSLGLLINRLMALYLIKDRFVIRTDYVKAFKRWKEYIDNPEDKILESLTELSEKRLTKAERQLLSDAKYFDSLNKEALKRNGFFDDSLNEEMLFAGKVLTYYNDVEFSKFQVLFPERYERISLPYLEQLVDNLIQYINRSISSMDNIERKTRMKRLLSALELPFTNIEEFLSYIRYSLDEKVTSGEEILFTIDTINYMLNEFREELN
ncbi:MAG: hypothetical protein GXY88_09035 [Tissierellia bacterium]|nr:hypothetical protein [Tissierellia bacterium]